MKGHSLQPCTWDEASAQALVELLHGVFVVPGYTDPEYAKQAFALDALKQRGCAFVATDADGVVQGMVMLVGPRGVAPNPGQASAKPPDTDREAALAWDEAQLHLLAVAPAARGRGLAAALIARVEQEARARGYSHLALSTQPLMRAAHRCYYRAGFVRQAQRDWWRGDKAYWVFCKDLRPVAPSALAGAPLAQAAS